MNFHINTIENEYHKKMAVRYPRPTYCEFINTSHQKHITKTVHSPISTDPYSDEPSDELCHGFQAEHNVSIKHYIFIPIDSRILSELIKIVEIV